MTLRIQGEILMDADQAKAELQATGTAAKTAAKDIGGVSVQGKNAGGGLKKVETGGKGAASGLTAASTAATANAAATRAMAASNRVAAGSMANLVAQGNDVITMMAAGQSPIQLALQQGTQITQVIGPLGAAGAFRALGGAVLSMLSPINLITIGSIAATAAVVNWFRSGEDEGKSFADSVEELGNRVDSLRDKIKEASGTRLELAEQFGAGFVDRAQNILDRIVEAEQRAAGRKATATITQFLGETDLNLDAVIAARNPILPSSSIDAGFAENARSQLARQFDLAEGLFGRLSGNNRRLVQQVLDDLADLSLAAEGTLQEQQAALEALIESYARAADAAGGTNAAEDAKLQLLREQQLELAKVIELQQQDPAQNRENEALVTSLKLITDRAIAQADADAAGRDLLGTMQEQNALAQAIARHGADSAEATRLRAQFALDAKLEEIEASEASDAIKQDLLDAAQAAFDLATADIAGVMAAGATEAARLSAEVRGAVDAMADLRAQGAASLETAQIRARFRDDPIGRAGALAGAQFDRETAPIREGGFVNAGEEAFLNSQRQAAIERAREIARLNELARPTRSSSGSRSGSISEAEREQQTIERLIATKNRELEALRETDPVQREMIRLRDQLKGATAAQRDEIEATIEAHNAERDAMESKEEFRQTLGDVLIEARTLKDVWGGIGDAVIRAAKEALILGQGPLAGLLGGGGGGIAGGIVSGVGGLFGLFSGGSLLSFANGGLPSEMISGFAGGGDPGLARPGIVLGAGSGRSDSITARISAGEFIMNAAATARNRPVLEAMNAGAIPGFAGGGLPLPRQSFDAGSASGAGGGGQGGGVTRLRIEPSDLFQVVAEERARNVAVEVVDDFSAQQLPGRVDQINRDPMGRG